MRIAATARLLTLAVLTLAAAMASPGRAAEPIANRAVSTATLPDLGPAGNGRRKWVQFQCYMCHGSNGAGQFGPNIQHAEAGDVAEAVRQGIPEWGMPSYGKWATAGDIANLTAYLNSIGTKGEPTWWDWWVPHPVQ